MRFIGLDAGSVSVKYVVLDEKGTKLNSSYVRHKGHPLKVAFELLREVIGSQQLKIQDAGYRIQDNHASCIMHQRTPNSKL